MDLTNVFVKIRCPNHPNPDGDEKDFYLCNAFNGGISAEELADRDWSKPFVDIRRCGSCGTIWKITIKDMYSVPVFEKMNGEIIKMIDFDTLFQLHQVKGRKIKS